MGRARFGRLSLRVRSGGSGPKTKKLSHVIMLGTVAAALANSATRAAAPLNIAYATQQQTLPPLIVHRIVSSYPVSSRTARSLAASLDGPWLCLHVYISISNCCLVALVNIAL
jgi:hypothetical protein